MLVISDAIHAVTCPPLDRTHGSRREENLYPDTGVCAPAPIAGENG